MTELKTANEMAEDTARAEAVLGEPLNPAGRYREKPIVIEAAQWFKNGDHPQDGNDGEGQVVRYFRRPDVSGTGVCTSCGATMHDHGWIDTLEGGHIVCVGDWIITGVEGERYTCKPSIFAATYEAAQ